MAQGGDGAEADTELAGAPDARLTALLRAPSPTAFPALRELRRRHHQAVLAYARLCTADESAAGRLTAETFTAAARETARGHEPNVPLRHQLLLLTARSAAAWAADERSAGVDAGLLPVLAAGGPDGPAPPLLPAFQTLPSRAQGLLWYGVLEAEPVERTAAYLGLSRVDVIHDTPRAVQALAQTCLRHRLARSDDPRCADFRRLIEESVRPDGPRRSADLEAHRAHCPHCTAAVEELAALRDAPRRTLAEGLLPWHGSSYLRASGPAPAPGPRVALRDRPPGRRYLLASTALGVALAPLLVFLLAPSEAADRHATAATPAPPPVTVTAAVAPSPSSTPAPSRTTGSPSPPPSPSPSPSGTAHRPATSPPPSPGAPPASPAPAPPGGAFAQVVNLATGRCLDIRDGELWKGNDVVMAPCDSSATQRWRVEAEPGVLRSAADSDYCLDSRGSTDRGVGIWECGSVRGRNGRNLRFEVDPDGTIRPAIDTGTAVTPYGGDGVVLRPLTGEPAQRWRAGAV
ncbi:RICIN domain-containing protein [Streptomyces cellostaticus]|uniref:RICIN domain-containing protein n=1 Tax=Streptomyces cellostaticus TaxID=67285 RepID=UPI002025E41B|nr:RICIN domain-containing protein [Streptomyces cellostaticus]